MARLGQKTLLVNPPLVNGVAFTRQGRCQEREEVLGTTKPPYTLALLAALFRGAGLDVRLVDLTASGETVEPTTLHNPSVKTFRRPFERTPSILGV